MLLGWLSMSELQELISSVVETSKVVSAKGHAEQAALQESFASVAAMHMVDGGVIKVADSAFLNSMSFDARPSESVIAAFSDRDISIIRSEGGERIVAMIFVESTHAFEGVPIFLQNYLAESMIPAVLCLVAEKIDIRGDGVEQFFVLPYFPIIDLSKKMPEPTIGFVGQDNRDRVVKNPEEAVKDAMSNLHIYMPLIASAVAFSGVSNG